MSPCAFPLSPEFLHFIIGFILLNVPSDNDETVLRHNHWRYISFNGEENVTSLSTGKAETPLYGHLTESNYLKKDHKIELYFPDYYWT